MILVRKGEDTMKEADLVLVIKDIEIELMKNKVKNLSAQVNYLENIIDKLQKIAVGGTGLNNGKQNNESKVLELKIDEPVKLELSELMLDIMLAVGSKGLSVSKDILEYILVERGGGFARSNILNTITILCRCEILSYDHIKIGRKNLNVYKLTSKGSNIYKKEFHDEPVVSEGEKFKKKYGSLNKAYFLQEVVSILQRQVEINAKDKLSIAENKGFNNCDVVLDIGNQTYYINVECSSSNIKGIVERIDRAIVGLKGLEVVVQSEKDRERIIKYMSGLKRGDRDDAVRIYTIESLTKGMVTLLKGVV